jgi:hypothetical protein
MAFATLPERRHLVQTHILLAPPFVWTFTLWRFGFHFFLEALWEWLRLKPKEGPFPQTAQILGIFLIF